MRDRKSGGKSDIETVKQAVSKIRCVSTSFGICEEAASRMLFRLKCDNVFELMPTITRSGAQICAGIALNP